VKDYKDIAKNTHINELEEELLLREILEKRSELKSIEKEYRSKYSKKISDKNHNKKFLLIEDYDLEDAKTYLKNQAIK
jgi:hypothetical protein